MKHLLLSAAAAALCSGTATAQTCLETTFASNNSGATGWANYMDVTVLNPTTVVSLEANFNVAAGSTVNLEVWTRSGTYVGSEQDPTGWTLVAQGDGTALALGSGNPTPVPLIAPFDFVPGGVTGVAIVYTEGGNPYTNGNGSNQLFTDGNMTIELGSSCSAPFVGGSVFTPRVWNGSFCTGSAPSIGTNYCQAELNSTGAAASMSASGSAVVASNDLVLEANDLPLNSFGFFLVASTSGFVQNPGGSEGNLCLGGAIGRYVGPGQIMSSGASGTISLAVDNTAVPQPNGAVAVAAGETYFFQLWNRDAVNGTATSNFTDGYEITFQ